MRPDNKIRSLFGESGVNVRAQYNDRTMNDAFAALEQSDRTESAAKQPDMWRIIMKNRITKLAVAAAVIFAVLIGVNHFGGSIDGATVAWAEVLEKVEQVQSVVYRTKHTTTGLTRVRQTEAGPVTEQPPDLEVVYYISRRHGVRYDSYIRNELYTSSYTLPEEFVTITVEVDHFSKTFSERMCSPDESDGMLNYEDLTPQRIIALMMPTEYKKIGRNIIDGINVEGIESKDPSIMYHFYDNVTARLWVEPATNLPVRYEAQGVAADGRVRAKIVYEDFQWNVQLDPSLFEPNIPSDYTLREQKGKLTKVKVSEGKAIQSLRLFAELAKGRYPSGLSGMTTNIEFRDTMIAKYGVGWREQMDEEHRIARRSASDFYRQLARENKDVVYYGDTVTAEDVDMVLMRWKISDNEYRVIFGDLTTENVPAESLAELEALLPE